MMKKNFKVSAAARRRRFFDLVHRACVLTAVGTTVLGLGAFGYFFYQFQTNKDSILEIRRQQLEDEIAAKQAEALKVLSEASKPSLGTVNSGDSVNVQTN